jgi:DNA-binding GntR family transcriptional regulator
MSVIVKTALAGQIVDVLRDRIIAGAIPAETPIRQDALAQELGVSKIPLREAFAKLEHEGLVVSQINRGFFVRPLSADEAYDVFDLRLKIEPEAVVAAMAHIAPEDRAEAKRALVALNAAVMARSSTVGALNRAFHAALIRPAGRQVTLQFVERLHVIAERYVVKHLEPLGRDDRAVEEHEALFDAWASGRVEETASLSVAHIETTLSDLKVQLERFDLSRKSRFLPWDKPPPARG